ncbi:hypothetical protein CSC80_12165 [Maribacter sp. 6B07]|uniref:PIN domain-containing protein n=1 Tax=Maribacter sp. 6B07 TaxID=2045442 RepID=UPI000C080724|nr:PIN domain-containing protein [Maribacter sp. 6B07]PHN93663.1 hypothetical protein CSC80_12165 [Maribacter sp. 6B07]
MNIIIDSTELKKDRGLNKSDISLIKDMGAEKLLVLHIPYFVYKECSSSSIENIKTELNQIKSNLKSFNRKGMGESDFAEARKIEKDISKLHDNVENSNKELWDNFVLESNSILYEFDEKDSIEVFDAYFTGDKPFKSLKSREDIPDAFIYQTIKKVSQTSKVYLVSGDKNLREKCVDLKNVVIFPTFDELYKDSDFIKLQQKYDKLKFNQRVADAKLILLDSQDSFEDAVNGYLATKNYWHLYDTGLPSDNGEATVYAIDDVSTEIDELNIKFIDDKFFVPIIVKGEASIDYAVFKADYWVDDDLPAISEDLNKHYYLLHDTVPIKLLKTVSIDLDDLKEDDILEFEIDEFDKIEIE